MVNSYRKEGYFSIGIYQPKTPTNIGTLWRSAYQLGASSIFTIGCRYKRQSSDTCHTPKKIPLHHYDDFKDLSKHLPLNTTIVGIETEGRALTNFVHPTQCCYLLGAEDYGIPQDILNAINHKITIPTVRQPSFNVSVAGSIVMYDRYAKLLL